MKESRILTAISLLTCVACAHAGVRAEYASDVHPSDEPVRVRVSNNYALPMEIYATGAGVVRRLGLVNPGLPSSFEVPRAMLESGGKVEFDAQPSGHGRMFQAFPVTLSPGDVVDFVIMTNLIGSHADVAAPRRR